MIGGTVQGEEGPQPVAGDVKRLEPNTEYEVRLVVSSEGGDETAVETFDTPLIKPTVKAAPAPPTAKAATPSQGVVNPNNSNVTGCKFEWGPNSADYAFSAPCSPAPGDEAKPVTVEAHLTGLNPGVIYHYHLLATNAAGTEEQRRPGLHPDPEPPTNPARQRTAPRRKQLPRPARMPRLRDGHASRQGRLWRRRSNTYDGGDRVAYSSEAGEHRQIRPEGVVLTEPVRGRPHRRRLGDDPQPQRLLRVAL